MSSVSKVFKKVREPNQLVCVTHPSIAFNFCFVPRRVIGDRFSPLKFLLLFFFFFRSTSIKGKNEKLIFCVMGRRKSRNEGEQRRL